MAQYLVRHPAFSDITRVVESASERDRYTACGWLYDSEPPTGTKKAQAATPTTTAVDETATTETKGK